MLHEPANLLVLRRDTATGLSKVGWAADMPLGRFEHIQSVCEVQDFPDTPSHPQHQDYVAACRRARQLNAPLIEHKRRCLQESGCIPVPLDLDERNRRIEADAFGSYQYLAQQARYRLSANANEVWAVVAANRVIRVHSCNPPRRMEALEYQVWKNHCLAGLMALEGAVYRGRLRVCESGLWFCASGEAVQRVEAER